MGEEEHDLSTVLRWEGTYEKYADFSEIRNYLAADHLLVEEFNGFWLPKWVFWSPDAYRKSQIIQDKIKTLVSERIPYGLLIQFWAPTVVKHRCCLRTSDQPFAVDGLYKGMCRYRKICMDDGDIFVDEGAKEEQLGAVGRVYLNGYPESSPDLRLYSTQELPSRDDAARCGATGYLVLPLFDLLECLCFYGAGFWDVLEGLEAALEKAELRTTHLKIDVPYYEEAENLADQMNIARDEIRQMLSKTKEIVPQLHMTQVWIPCKQCATTTIAFCCMELVDYILENDDDDSLTDYLDAIHLESAHNSNDSYYVEFFLQPNSGRDLCGVSLCHLLIEVMKTTLNSFKVISSDIVEVRKDMRTNSIQLVNKTSGILEGEKHQHVKESNILTTGNRGWKTYQSGLEFQKHLQMDNLCFESGQRWCLFWCPQREELCENDENYSSALQTSTQDKIKPLLQNLVKSDFFNWHIYIVQIWAQEMNEGRCYLTTSGQPFALCGLREGLAFFRKQSMKHLYFVDEGVKEEGIGPIGRVFRSGHPEMTHNLRLYSTTEFPLKDDAAFCDLTGYIAFPILDHQNKCHGVLEFVAEREYFDDWRLKQIQSTVKAQGLSSHQICEEPKWHGGIAGDEIKRALYEVPKISQLYGTEVWVPENECSNTINSLTCMRLYTSTLYKKTPFDLVETRKGIVGMVLASENKCCYCKNSCQFRITEQSRPHYAQLERLDVCFAICLHSSDTGDLPFVLKFFLNQGPGHHEYLWSFLYYLLPILKQQLKSFKVATGKQLGEELVVDIIEFSQDVNQPTSFQFGQPNMFPVKCQIIQYNQQEHQESNDQQVNEMDHFTSSVAEGNQCGSTLAANLKEKEETSRRIEKGKMRTGLRITLEDLKGQFGKNREDAAKNLSVGVSTLKRACRFHGIDRWPSNKRHIKNPSLYMSKDANAYDGDPQRSTGEPSRSSLNLPLDQNMPLTNTKRSQERTVSTPTNTMGSQERTIIMPTNTEGSQEGTVVPETDLVIVKAKYEDEIVKFRFCLSMGLVNLCKEVGSGLNLDLGSFKLKYVDEDNDHISLTRDADLQLYAESLKVAGKNCMSVFVRLMG